MTTVFYGVLFFKNNIFLVQLKRSIFILPNFNAFYIYKTKYFTTVIGIHCNDWKIH